MAHEQPGQVGRTQVHANTMGCEVTGGPLKFSPKVPAREKAEVLAAFAAHKNEVTAGYQAK